MNKLFALLVLSVGLAACSDTGRGVDAGDAQEVKTGQTEESITYRNLKEGSAMNWRAAHFGGVEPRYGKVFPRKVYVLVNDGAVSNAMIEFDMSTFTVENFKDEEQIAKLSGHLQSEDFFNIAKYPISIFELTKLESTEGDFNSSVTGNLTILDSTKSITFMANVNVSESEVSIASEDFAVDRRDWGLVYNVEGSEGVPVEYIVANDIGFTINITLTK
jgi:polyisoprenoid-binding protein YceI